MPKEKNREIELPSLDELFSTQEERDDAKLRRIEEIPLDKIDPFPDHPYKVRDDEDMMNLVESVKANGVITPATLRKKWDGRYEIISGHRRKRACELAGFKTLRAEVVDMNRNEARRHISLDTGLEHSEWLRSYDSDVYQQIAAEEDAADIRAAIDALSDSQKDLIQKIFDEGMSIKDYAEACGVKPSAISHRIRTIRNNLKEILK